MRTLAVVMVSASLLLTGCATPTGGTPPASGPDLSVWQPPAPPVGVVQAQGMVMDVAGGVELCLGLIAESYPPQCSGLAIEDWSWDGVEGSESVGDVTWGMYALEGTFDGTAFTVTAPPIMLALYDPMPFPDPTDDEVGRGDDDELERIQQLLPQRLGDDGSVLANSYIQRGWLWLDVVWDDGTLQKAADAEFGDHKVIVRSALREVG